ncbi:hypothetical protein [Pseudomonas sp.]|uniref:hypothetical protein n=2 Tax=Pseudomonas TaxID=286 RepID=UPI003D0C66C2
MKCWYTYSRSGILSNQFSFSVNMEYPGKIINHKGVLFLFYVAEGNGGTDGGARLMTKVSVADAWSDPVGIEFGTFLHEAMSVFTFKDKLYVLCSGDAPSYDLVTPPRLAEYDELTGAFTVANFSTDYRRGASFVENNGRLYMFYKAPGTTALLWRSTGDMATWSTPRSVKIDGVRDLHPAVEPAVISYHGLIHLIVKSGTQPGWELMRFDGESAWACTRTFIGKDHPSSPGVAIHNGLLKVAFSDTRPNGSRGLDLYAYDGNSLSSPESSFELGAQFQVSMAVQDDYLYVVYRGRS